MNTIYIMRLPFSLYSFGWCMIYSECINSVLNIMCYLDPPSLIGVTEPLRLSAAALFAAVVVSGSPDG